MTSWKCFEVLPVIPALCFSNLWPFFAIQSDAALQLPFLGRVQKDQCSMLLGGLVISDGKHQLRTTTLSIKLEDTALQTESTLQQSALKKIIKTDCAVSSPEVRHLSSKLYLFLHTSPILQNKMNIPWHLSDKFRLFRLAETPLLSNCLFLD